MGDEVMCRLIQDFGRFGQSVVCIKMQEEGRERNLNL